MAIRAIPSYLRIFQGLFFFKKASTTQDEKFWTAYGISGEMQISKWESLRKIEDHRLSNAAVNKMTRITDKNRRRKH